MSMNGQYELIQTYVVCNVQCLAIIYSSGVITRDVVYAGREEVGIVSLPEADVHIES
jgi:hypothetical protein